MAVGGIQNPVVDGSESKETFPAYTHTGTLEFTDYKSEAGARDNLLSWGELGVRIAIHRVKNRRGKTVPDKRLCPAAFGVQ